MKKFLLAFLCLLAVGVSPGWAEAASYSIAFNVRTENSDSNTALTTGAVSNLSTIISAGKDNVSKATISGSVYLAQSGYGLKFAKSGAEGKLTLDLASSAQVVASSVVVNCNPYAANNKLKVTITYADNKTKETTFTLSSTSFSDKTISDLSTISPIKSIELQAAKGNQVYVKSVTVNYENATPPPAADPCRVTFNAGAGSCSDPYLDEAYAGAGVTLPTATISLSGWTFAGWSISTVSETTSEPTLLEAGKTFKPSQNCTLYAVYKATSEGGAETFKLSLVSGNTTYYVGKQNGTNKYLNNPTSASEAAIFGIEENGGKSYLYYEDNDSKKYISIDKADKADITFSDNIPTTSSWVIAEPSAGVFTFTSTVVNNERYRNLAYNKTSPRFAGYYSNEDSTYPNQFNKIPITTTVTTYDSNPTGAVTSKYAVNYNANGGSGSMSDPNSPYAAGASVTVLSNTFTRDSYNFLGWKDNAAGTGDFYTGSFTMPEHAVTLYAQWSPIVVSSVLLDQSEASVEMGSTLTLNATVSPADALDKTVTWSSSDPGIATVANGVVTPVAVGGPVTITASCGSASATCQVTVTPREFTVTYNANGATGTVPAVATVTEGNSLTLATAGDLAKEGYHFTGWNTSAEGNDENTYAAGASFTPTANTTLYARWAINTYSVTWKVNGAQVGETVTVNHGERVATLPANPSAAAFGEKIFVGWSASDCADLNRPVDLFTSAPGSPQIFAPTVFNAVFASVEGTAGEYEWVKQTEVPATTAGEYVLVSAGTTPYVMKAAVTENNRLSNGTNATLLEDKSKMTSTPAPDEIWTIYFKDGKYRIKNGSNFASGTTAKNTAQLLTNENHDLTKWEISYGEGSFTFKNYGRTNEDTPANAYLRSNGNAGWACYAVSGTGQPPVLYKKTETASYAGFVTSTSQMVEVAVESVSLPESLTLTLGTSQKLTPEFTPANATNKAVTWGSSNSDIVSVADDGTVTAIASGEADITVTTSDGDHTATCHVTVPVVAVTGITVSPATATLYLSGKTTLTATIEPANAANKNVEWTSSDPAIASVDEEGNVIANGPGTATITVTTEDGSKTATCTVTVNDGYYIKDGYYTTASEITSETEWFPISNISGNVEFKYIRWDYNPIVMHYTGGGSEAKLYGTGNTLRWYANNVMAFEGDASVMSLESVSFNKKAETLITSDEDATVSYDDSSTTWTSPVGVDLTTATMKAGAQINPTVFYFNYLLKTRPEAPVISPEAGAVYRLTPITITRPAGASYYQYKIDEGEWSENFTAPETTFALEGACTVYARATNDFGVSEISSAAYTIAASPLPGTVTYTLPEGCDDDDIVIIDNNSVVTVSSEGAAYITYSISGGETVTVAGNNAQIPILYDPENEEIELTVTAINADNVAGTASTKIFMINIPGNITFTPADKSDLNYNQRVTITSSSADQICYQISYDLGETYGEVYTVDVDGDHSIQTIPLKQMCTIKAWGLRAGAPGNVATADYDVAAGVSKYVLQVTDNSQLAEDLEYVITKATQDYIMTPTITSGAEGSLAMTEDNEIVVYDEVSNIIEIEEYKYETEVAHFKLVDVTPAGETEKVWAIQMVSDFDEDLDGKYLASNENSLSYVDAIGDNTKVKIDIADDKSVSIVFLNDANTELQYNSGKFKPYTSSQSKIRLFSVIDMTKAMAPRVAFSRTADDQDYYNNEVSLTVTPLTPGSKLKYSTDGGANWTSEEYTSPLVLTADEPVNYAFKSVKSEIDDSDVVACPVKFRPALPTFNVEDGLSISKKVVITPSATVGAASFVKVNGAWISISEPYTVAVAKSGDVEAKVSKMDYDPETRETSFHVDVTDDGTGEQTHSYDTGHFLTKPWKDNNSSAFIENYGDENHQGVNWKLDVEWGSLAEEDRSLSYSSGMQIGKAGYPAESFTVSSTEFPGEISTARIHIVGTHGGTVTAYVNGVQFGNPVTFGDNLTWCTFTGAASGPLTFVVTPDDENTGRIVFDQIKVDYTPIAAENKVRTPQFSRSSGEVIIGSKVEISCNTENAAIYYTLDGTEPTSASTRYVNPIILNDEGHITLKAIAYQGNLEPSNVVTAYYTVIDADVYELVTKDTPLNENDSFIFVNAVPYTERNPQWAYYGFSLDQRESTSKKAWYYAVGMREIEGEEGEPRKLVVDNNEHPLAVVTLQLDGSAQNPDRPWLLSCGEDEDENQLFFESYFVSKDDRHINIVTLPENFNNRSRFNAMVKIEDAEDYNYYKQNGTNCNTTNEGKGVIVDKAIVAFAGKVSEDADTKLTTIRFNPDGGTEHFSNYGYELENGVPKLHASTWPVQIYRTTPVLPPSVTVYPQEVTMANYNDPVTYSEVPAASSVTTFYNPVKILVTENPRTKKGASLLYNWSKTVVNAPVASEYEEIEGTEGKGAEVSMYLDGFNFSFDCLSTEEGHDKHHALDLRTLSTSNDYMSSALRVMSSLGDKDSRSMPHSFEFATTAPVVTAMQQDGQDGVKVSRPKVFTKGAILYYTIEGEEPSVTWNENGTIQSAVGTPLPLDQLDTFIPLTNGQTIRVGAFKFGYKPAVQAFNNQTVIPFVKAVQLLELTNEGVDALVNNAEYPSTLLVKQLPENYDSGNYKVTLELNSEIDDVEGLGMIYDEDNFKIVNNPLEKTYLTYRTDESDKYYMVHYESVFNEETGKWDLDLLHIADINDDAAKAVIANPHLYKWTADYYVNCMDKATFNATVPHELYVENSGKVTVHDSGASATGHWTTVTINENLAEGEHVETNTYVGTVLTRKGSLGQNSLWVELEYKAKKNAEDSDDKAETYNTETVAAISPEISLPFDLKFKYETVREENPDGFSIPDEGYTFTTGSSIEGYEDVENTLTFAKEHFALRHLDCVFTFHRPNVCDDIIDNYDIVYDVEITTGSGMNNFESRLVDWKRSSEIGYAAENDEDHDKVNRYEFRVTDVHPNAEVFPTLTIKNVWYIPNGYNDGYSTYKARYNGNGANIYKQVKAAPNTTKGMEFKNTSIGIYWEEVGENDYTWRIHGHSDLKNEAYAHVDDDEEDVQVEAPFMYHVEAQYEGGQEGNEKHYRSHNVLVQHDARECSEASANYADPFGAIILGEHYKSLDHLPTVYITPIYFFKRQPEPSVIATGDNEQSLDFYEIYQQQGVPSLASENGPKKAPRRAPEDNAEGLADDENPAQTAPQIVIVRGSKFAKVAPGNGVFVGVENVEEDGEVWQDGNNLMLPAGAQLFDLNGLQVHPYGLTAGVYIVRFANGHTLKVAVR